MPDWNNIFEGKSRVAKRNAILLIALVGVIQTIEGIPAWVSALLQSITPLI